MPFDLTSLNGVTFSGDEVALKSSTNIGIEFSEPTGSDQVGIFYINYLGSSVRLSNAVNSYTAGYYVNGNYYLPTFGSITVQSAGNSLFNNATVYVHGFSDNALLVSVDLNGTHGSKLAFGFSSQGGQPITANGSVYVGLFSNTNLGSGMGSPAYNRMQSNAYQDIYGYSHYVYKFTYVDPDTGISSSGYTAYNTPYNNNPNPPTFPITFTKDSTTYTPPCFAQGVRVLTTEGEVRVEDLAVGDVAVTASGALRPVIWVGSRRVVPASYPEPSDVMPVRIRAHALAPGRPSRDLVVSPGHALHVDGVLVPAARLVNGATVVQEAVEAVRYFHVELDAHDVLLADGLPCESFLDDGNRATFANSEAIDLHGRLDPSDREHACAPVLRETAEDATRLAAIRATLRARAETLGWVAAHRGALYLRLADGSRLEPLHATDGRAWFLSPAGEVRLVSAAARPCEFAPVDGDRRRLGVAVSQLRLDGVALPLDGPALGDGFHPPESDDALAWRWTDGHAALTLPAPGLLEVVTPMLALTWDRVETPALRLVAG